MATAYRETSIGREFGTAFAADALVETLTKSPLFQELGDWVKEELKRRAGERPDEAKRVDGLAAILVELRAHDFRAFCKLQDYLQDATNWKESQGRFGPADENRIMRFVVAVWDFHIQKGDPKRGLEVIAAVANAPDHKELLRLIDHFEHDPLKKRLDQVVEKVKGFVGRVNFWGRVIIGAIVTIFALQVLTAIADLGKLTLIPLEAMALILVLVTVAYRYPVVFALLGLTGIGQAILKPTLVTIGVELAIASYLTLVPVHTAPGLLPLLGLFLGIIVFLGMKKKPGGLTSWFVTLSSIGIIVVTVVFFQKTDGGLRARVDEGKTFAHEVKEAVAPKGISIPAIVGGTVDFFFPATDSTIWAKVEKSDNIPTELPPVDTVRVMVPPGNQWTTHFIRNPKAKFLKNFPAGRCKIRADYADGSYDEFEDFPRAALEAKAPIVGIRIMNPYYSVPIEIKIVQHIH